MFCFCFSVWTQILNRTQQRLDLVLIPLDNFCETYNLDPKSHVNPTMEWKGPNNSINPIKVNTLHLIVLHYRFVFEYFLAFYFYKGYILPVIYDMD